MGFRNACRSQAYGFNCCLRICPFDFFINCHRGWFKLISKLLATQNINWMFLLFNHWFVRFGMWAWCTMIFFKQHVVYFLDQFSNYCQWNECQAQGVNNSFSYHKKIFGKYLRFNYFRIVSIKTIFNKISEHILVKSLRFFCKFCHVLL